MPDGRKAAIYEVREAFGIDSGMRLVCDITGRNFREFPEKCVTSQKSCRKFLRSFSGNLPKITENFLKIVRLTSLQCNDTE